MKHSPINAARPVYTDTHEGWSIEEYMPGQWVATHPDYEGPDDTRCRWAETRDEIIEEINLWIEDHEEPEREPYWLETDRDDPFWRDTELAEQRGMGE